MTQTLIRGSTQIMPGTITSALLASSLNLPTSQLQDGAKFIKSDGTLAMAAALNMASFNINNLATPVNAGDAATKAYVDALANGLTFHQACRVVSTSNLPTLSGLLTVDAVTLVTGNRVLLTAQTTGSTNSSLTAKERRSSLIASSLTMTQLSWCKRNCSTNSPLVRAKRSSNLAKPGVVEAMCAAAEMNGPRSAGGTPMRSVTALSTKRFSCSLTA